MKQSRPGGPPAGSNFTEGAVHRHIIRLSGFMFMGMGAMITAQLIETIYIGTLGTKQLAAVSFTFPVVMVMQSVAMGLGIGASSIIARTAGGGDRETVRRLVSHCIWLVVIVMILMAVAGRALIVPMFELLGADPLVMPYIQQYMEIWYIGMPLFTISMIGTSLLRSVGDAATPGIVMTFGSLIQIVIGPVLIFGLGPFPRMELEGAAWGFAIARLLSFTYCYFVIIYREKLLISNFENLLSSWKSILHVGIPAIANNLIQPVSMAIITRLLAGHGNEVVAGFGVASRVDSLMMMVAMSVSASCGPLIGQNWGAKKYDRVDTTLRITNSFVLVWGAVAFVIMLLFGETLVSLINDDPLVVEPASWYLVIIPLSIGFMGITAIASSSFNAMGKPLPPLIISVLRMFVLYVPMAIVFDHLWGYIGVFVATAISTVITGILSWYWNNITVAKNRQPSLVTA